MSLDITLYEGEEIDGNEVYSTNVTHNLGNMASEAGIYNYLWRAPENNINNAKQLILPLTKAIEDMELKPSLYDPLSAKNGWGTYEQFIPWLKELLQACKDYPNARIDTNR